MGTIPIIQRSAVDDAYHHFPVVFVDSWGEVFGDDDKAKLLLEKWVKELAPFYEHGSHLRQRTLDVRARSPPWRQGNVLLHATFYVAVAY